VSGRQKTSFLAG